jgi:hypothetical protein
VCRRGVWFSISRLLARVPFNTLPVDGCAWEHKLIQCALPAPEFKQSYVDCLTLNITVPAVQNDNNSSRPLLHLCTVVLLQRAAVRTRNVTSGGL